MDQDLRRLSSAIESLTREVKTFNKLMNKIMFEGVEEASADLHSTIVDDPIQRLEDLLN